MLTNGEDKKIDIMFGTGASSAKNYGELFSIIRTAVCTGIVGFDTAPNYKTESVLGKCLTQCMKELELSRTALFIQTKIDAWQMAEGTEKIRNYLEKIIQDMKIQYLDSLCIHWPLPEYLDETWDCLTKLQKEGIVRYIGICNFRMRQLRKLYEYEVIPQFIQLERHPLRTCEREIAFCHSNNITVQAYSPLCKMHSDIANSEIIYGLAEKYNKNIGQIVLRWHLDTGVIPIFTSKKESRIREYTSIDDFSLTNEEVELINEMNKDYKMYLEACVCPGF